MKGVIKVIFIKERNTINNILQNPNNYITAGDEKPLVEIHKPDTEEPTVVSIGVLVQDIEYPIKCFYIATTNGHINTRHYCESKELPDVFSQLLRSIQQEENS